MNFSCGRDAGRIELHTRVHWVRWATAGGLMIGERYDAHTACSSDKPIALVLMGRQPLEVVTCPDCLVAIVKRELDDAWDIDD